MKRVAIALVALLALSGCSEIGSLSDKAQIDLALGDLTTGLDAVAGITTKYTAELQPDFTYQVSVHATAPELDDEQLLTAALLARDSLSDGVFDRTQALFDLSVPEGALLSMRQFDITDAELRAALELAAEAADAYGSLSSLSVGDGMGISLLTASSSPDWDAIRALVDASERASWAFPGLSFEGTMPSSDVTDLVDAIGEILPLGFSEQVYVSVDWYGDTANVTVAAPGVDVADPTASSYWPQAQQVVALLAASPLPARTFMFYGLDNQGTASVFFGDCAESVLLSDGDAALAEALEGVTAGQCLTA